MQEKKINKVFTINHHKKTKYTEEKKKKKKREKTTSRLKSPPCHAINKKKL